MTASISRPFTRRFRAFTLVELLVVMSVIVILMSLLVPTLNAVRRQLNRARTESLIRGVAMGLEQYRTVHQVFPPDRCATWAGSTKLDKSAECVVYFLSGASIAYTGTAPAGYPWVDVIFAVSGRTNSHVFRAFRDNELMDGDGDKVPEVKDPWGRRLIYNAGPATANDAPTPYNQFGAPKHNLWKFDLFSAGPDGKYGTDDDIKNWADALPDPYKTYGPAN